MNTRSQMKVAVIGGGIAGLSTAWRLGQAGCRVHLFERSGLPSRAGAATWASAGMICARLEMSHVRGALAHFALQARAAWPNFAREIEQASGRSCGYVERGALQIAFDADRPAEASDGLVVIDGQEAQRLEPGLSPRVSSALWAADEAQAEPRLTVLALEAACRQADVALWPETVTDRLLTTAGRVTGIDIGGREVTFDHVVLAGGAWSSQLLAASSLAGPEIVPVKGETISLAADPRNMPISRIIWAESAYIVPHVDGRIVVGATQKRVGFDVTPDSAEVEGLLAAAIEAVPALAELREMGRSVGLRPASADDAPALGGIGIDGLTLASGQFRNGILFAPLIAHATATHVLRGALPDIAKPFAAARLMLEPS